MLIHWTGEATYVEDAELLLRIVLDQLGLVDGTDTELTLDGSNQRRTLEESTSELLQSLLELGLALDGVVEADDGDVLLTGGLLALDGTSSTIDTDDETASDLGIQGAAVAGSLASQDALDPGDDLVGGGIGRLVEMDETVATRGSGRAGEHTRCTR